LSSAILYVAIIAIWAGVLIPRWLRRDSAAGGRNSEHGAAAAAKPEAEVGAEVGAGAEVAEEPAPAPAPRRRKGAAAREAPSARRARYEELVMPRPASVRPGPPRPVPRPEIPEEIPHGEPRGREHKKTLSSRRRLLGLLLVLTIAAGALAFTRMAAWWVVVPSAVMLLGYLTLLYEAGRADAERRELARTREAAAASAAAEVAAAKRATPPAPAAPPPAPDAEVIDISASLTVAGHKFYDQYADTKLRAVGDLSGPVTGRARLAARREGRQSRIALVTAGVPVVVRAEADDAAPPHRRRLAGDLLHHGAQSACVLASPVIGNLG
jgi:hypothetical protein